MLKLKDLFVEKGERLTARRLLEAVIAQARRPEFYVECGVPDTIDGRFDCATLHAWLVLAALRGNGTGGHMAQLLTDRLFRYFDDALRELGVSDLSVARKMKGVASAFYGRLAAYDAAWATSEDERSCAIRAALARNLYRDGPVSEAALDAMARYVVMERQRLPAAGHHFQAGDVPFGPLPTPDGTT